MAKVRANESRGWVERETVEAAREFLVWQCALRAHLCTQGPGTRDAAAVAATAVAFCLAASLDVPGFLPKPRDGQGRRTAGHIQEVHGGAFFVHLSLIMPVLTVACFLAMFLCPQGCLSRPKMSKPEGVNHTNGFVVWAQNKVCVRWQLCQLLRVLQRLRTHPSVPTANAANEMSAIASRMQEPVATLCRDQLFF